MAILDRVISKPMIGINTENGGFMTPPLIGTLLTGADPSAIQWENGEQNSLPLDDLVKVLDPDPEAAQLVGKWLQIRALPAIVPSEPFEGGIPKSPGASGTCVRALGFGDLGTTERQGTVLVIALANGTEVSAFFVADIPGAVVGAFVVNDGRREVSGT